MRRTTGLASNSAGAEDTARARHGELPGQTEVANDTNVISGCFPAGKDVATKYNQFYDTVAQAYSALPDTLDGTLRIADTQQSAGAGVVVGLADTHFGTPYSDTRGWRPPVVSGAGGGRR